MACVAGQVCVRSRFQGGPCMLPTDGGCPPGYSPSSTCCLRDPTYACMARPAGCGATLICACAASTLCNAGYD